MEGTTLEITHTGSCLSLNTLYKQDDGNFELIIEYKKMLMGFFKQKILEIPKSKRPRVEKYRIELRYHSRIDPTNTIPMIKIFEDTLKKAKIIIEDSPKFCKEIKITVDENAPPRTYQFILYAIT